MVILTCGNLVHDSQSVMLVYSRANFPEADGQGLVIGFIGELYFYPWYFVNFFDSLISNIKIIELVNIVIFFLMPLQFVKSIDPSIGWCLPNRYFGQKPKVRNFLWWIYFCNVGWKTLDSSLKDMYIIVPRWN